VENFIADFLRLSQALIIPSLIIFSRYIKKQTETQRDIRDLKTYVLAICKEMKVPCTLKDV
jgi:hypothetical protein